MSELSKFDRFLTGDGPAALVVREWMMPVEGHDGVLFPTTFASGDGFEGGYNIDVFPNESTIGPTVAAMTKDGRLKPSRQAEFAIEVCREVAAMIKDGRLKPTPDLFPTSPNVCLVDSVGSQANRIEPLFAEGDYKALVPQIVIKAGDKQVNLLEAGHRAGDAIVRCSELQQPLQLAFKAVLSGDAEPLAKLAPTSLVFGVWDSRDTQAKLPRVLASTVRAYDVRKLRRSAQFTPATEYVADGLLDEPGDKATKDAYAVRGFVHVPATGSHGGVIADGGIRRDATLGLAALRLLRAGKDDAKTLALQRYILGLALTAFTHNPSGYLRQGCLLVLDPDKPREFVEVYPSGQRKPATITHEQALAYATAAAEAFGVGASKTVPFDKDRAKKDVQGDGDTKTKAKKGK